MKLATAADVAFQDVVNDSPNCLSTDQIAHYNSHGFISPISLFSKEETAANRSYFDGLLAQLNDNNAYAINCYQARLSGLWDICTHPTLLDHVEDLLGPNIVCWASHFFCKLPQDPKRVPWHQDACFWHLSPTRTVTAWVAIDDADEDNSAMEFLPKTHRNGQLPIKDVGVDSVLGHETDNIDETQKAFSNNLKAGQISLHADMLVHGSRPNNSNRRRCGLTIRYCPTDVRMVHEKWASGVEPILCRGVDVDGYWQHRERPNSDEMILNKIPVNIGNN